MKKLFFNILLLGVIVFGVSSIEAWAQKPLKGNWLFTVQTAIGPVPAPISFLKKGKATFTTPQGALQVAYREASKGNTFSLVLEAPGLAPDGSDLTILIRGTKTNDNNITGMVYFITDTPDSSSSVNFTVGTGTVTGTRQ